MSFLNVVILGDFVGSVPARGDYSEIKSPFGFGSICMFKNGQVLFAEAHFTETLLGSEVGSAEAVGIFSRTLKIDGIFICFF